MAFNALNSAAPMNMPDFEDASPAHFQPAGGSKQQPVATFAALQNAKQIFEGAWSTKSYDVVKKGKTRSYKIDREARRSGRRDWSVRPAFTSSTNISRLMGSPSPASWRWS